LKVYDELKDSLGDKKNPVLFYIENSVGNGVFAPMVFLKYFSTSL